MSSPDTTDPTADDAALDPWCVIELPTGSHLFGYALRHPETDGLAWTRSSPIVELNAELGRAVTQSGRRYRLGQRVNPADLQDQEPRLALALLRNSALRNPRGPLPGGISRVLAVAWLTACKAARHSELEPPPLDADAIKAFFAEHFEHDLGSLLSDVQP